MEVVLKVDGKDIEMNDFVQKILGNTVRASTEILKGVDENWKSLEISLKR